MEICELDMLYSEEELEELLRDDTPTGDNEVGCYGNQS